MSVKKTIQPDNVIKNGTIIYVGKAKILKNRVRSYFTGSHNTKTERLVSEIEDFEYIVTESNIEALLLEINLIKKNDPSRSVFVLWLPVKYERTRFFNILAFPT